MARAINCGSQKQGHTDAALTWCGKEVALVGFGMNRMGAHFNPVSVSPVDAESKEGIKNSYQQYRRDGHAMSIPRTAIQAVQRGP